MKDDPYKTKNCYFCSYMFMFISIMRWCRNEEAVAARGTNIAGTSRCLYWSPNKDKIVNSIHFLFEE